SVTRTGHRGEWQLTGYERAHIEASSHRRHDITQRLAAQGVNSAAAAQIAAHQSRLAKDHRTETEMRQEWQTRATSLGLNLAQRTGEAQTQRPTPIAPDAVQQMA